MKKHLTIKGATPVLAAALLASGCATQTPKVSTDNDVAIANKLKVLEQKEAALARKERELSERSDSLARAAAETSVATTNTNASGDLLPPKGKPGECYARVWVEPSYKTVTQNILVKEESTKVTVVPAQYETVEEKVLVKQASSVLKTLPAEYKTVKERKLVQEGSEEWRVSLSPNAHPASQKLIDAAAKHVDLKSAKPGMCFHEHIIPAKYESVKEQVLLKDAYDVVGVEKAKFRWVEQKVLVSEASSRLEVVPAVYKTVTEKVIDVPAHTIWKKGSGPVQRIDEATGEIMCLVEVPDTYKIITKQVLVTPETTRKVDIPAKYKTVKVKELIADAKEVRNTVPAKYGTVSVTKKVSDPSFVWHEIHDNTMSKESRTGNQICLTKQAPKYKDVSSRVLVKAAETKKVEIPAEYQTVKVRKQVKAAEEKITKIPAEYKTVTLKEIEREGRMAWRSILCETNMDVRTISRIQTALKQKGYNPGAIDGVIGHQTMQAVNAFQRDNKLPVDKHLNMKTVNALGIRP